MERRTEDQRNDGKKKRGGMNTITYMYVTCAYTKHISGHTKVFKIYVRVQNAASRIKHIVCDPKEDLALSSIKGPYASFRR